MDQPSPPNPASSGKSRTVVFYYGLIVIAALCLARVTLQIPRFSPLFRGFSEDLPLVTVLVVRFSRWLVMSAWGWVLVAVFGGWRAYRSPQPRIRPVLVMAALLVIEALVIGGALYWGATIIAQMTPNHGG